MTASTFYLATSLLFGLAQLVDAFVLWKKRGRLNSMIVAFSKAELVWAIVSFFVWHEIDAPWWPWWFPLSFTVYVATLFVLGMATQKRIREEGIPRSLVLAGGVFGVYFATAAYVYLTLK